MVPPDAAEDPERWLFHPLHSMNRDPDGLLTVCLRAGAPEQMCSHLLTWETALTILAAYSLRVEMA